MSEETGDKDDAFPISEAVFHEILNHSIKSQTPIGDVAIRQIARVAGFNPDQVIEYHNQERDSLREEEEGRLSADDAMPVSFTRIPFVQPPR